MVENYHAKIKKRNTVLSIKLSRVNMQYSINYKQQKTNL